ERAQHSAREVAGLHARRDDRATRPPGRDHARAGDERERHAVPAEAQPALRHALGGVAALLVDRRVLGEADGHDAPVELVAEAPADRAHETLARVRPRAAGVGDLRDGDLVQRRFFLSTARWSWSLFM